MFMKNSDFFNRARKDNSLKQDYLNIVLNLCPVSVSELVYDPDFEKVRGCINEINDNLSKYGQKHGNYQSSEEGITECSFLVLTPPYLFARNEKRS